jgi:Ca-activated chloride channel homolog
MELSTPLALLLLPAPLLVRALPPPREGSGTALRLPGSVLARFGLAGETRGGTAARLYPLLPWLLWLALVAALAGPRVATGTTGATATGRDIMLALDLSGSMLQEDFSIDGKKASRIDALKRAGAAFIRRRAGDRIGLVIFAEEAYAVAPLSFDTETVSHLLEQAEVGIVGRSTAIGDGLGLALKRLGASNAKARVVVLLSDGANDAGTTDPVAVASLAGKMGVRVHTIALGRYDKETDGEARDAVDSAALREIARVSGGTSFRVRDSDDLEAASRAIDALEASPQRAPPRILYRELWMWPAALALMLAMVLVWRGR